MLAWDIGGLDLPVERAIVGADGFTLRNAWWTELLLHRGGRWLAAALLVALAATALRPAARGPTRRERGYWLAVTVLTLLLVPGIKRFSTTSCPWDLAEFGAVARYLSHWAFALHDGGPGHCFPSGHAVAAFAFFSQYFLWRRHDRQRARRWLAGVLLAGALFGLGQVLRGAHYVSHVLWSALLCWGICVAALSWRGGGAQREPFPAAEVAR